MEAHLVNTVTHFFTHGYHHVESIAVIMVGYEHVWKLFEHVFSVVKKGFFLVRALLGGAEEIVECIDDVTRD